MARGARINPDTGLAEEFEYDDRPVRAGAREAHVAAEGIDIPDHDCMDHAVPYTSDGALGHGWECGLCGAFLQAG